MFHHTKTLTSANLVSHVPHRHVEKKMQLFLSSSAKISNAVAAGLKREAIKFLSGGQSWQPSTYLSHKKKLNR